MNMMQVNDHAIEISSSAAQFSRVVDKGTLHESDFGASLVGNLEDFFQQNRHRINVRRLERDFDGCVLDGILTPEECDSLVRAAEETKLFSPWNAAETEANLESSTPSTSAPSSPSGSALSMQSTAAAPSPASLLGASAEGDGLRVENRSRSAQEREPEDSPFRRADTVEVSAENLARVVFDRIRRLLLLGGGGCGAACPPPENEDHQGGENVAESSPASTPIIPFRKSFCDEDADDYELDLQGEWELDSLNPTFLFARYKNGGHFSPHTDGTTVFNFNTRTLYTVLVYLNDFEGAENDPCSGATRVYDDAQIWEALQVVDESLEDEKTKARRRIVGNERHVVDTILPKKGRVLIFYHRLMHEGLPSKNKYIIRTDLVFKRTPELLTSEVDKEAFAMYQEAEKLAELGKNREAMEKFRWAFGMSPELRRIYKQ